MENVLIKFNQRLDETFRKIGHVNNIYFIYLYSSMLKMLELTSPSILDETYDIWLKDEDKQEGEWFRQFHKTMRQCGSFNGFKKSTLIPSTLTDEEKIRLSELMKLQKEKIIDELDKLEFNSDEYKRKDVELFIENKEWLRELRTLRAKKSHYEDENVDGYLDSILYNLIHADDSNALFTLLNHFFEDVRDNTTRDNLMQSRTPEAKDVKYVEEK